MVHSVMEWVGFYNDNTFMDGPTFWSTPAGLFITSSIAISATLNIIHPGIDDNLFDRIWYSILALLMLVAVILGLNPHTEPHHIIQTLMILLCIRCIYSVVYKHHRFRKTGKVQKTVGM